MPKRNTFSSNIFCHVDLLSTTGIKMLDFKDNNSIIDSYPTIWNEKISDRNFIPNDMYLPIPSGWKEIEKDQIGVKISN